MLDILLNTMHTYTLQGCFVKSEITFALQKAVIFLIFSQVIGDMVILIRRISNALCSEICSKEVVAEPLVNGVESGSSWTNTSFNLLHNKNFSSTLLFSLSFFQNDENLKKSIDRKCSDIV